MLYVVWALFCHEIQGRVPSCNGGAAWQWHGPGMFGGTDVLLLGTTLPSLLPVSSTAGGAPANTTRLPYCPPSAVRHSPPRCRLMERCQPMEYVPPTPPHPTPLPPCRQPLVECVRARAPHPSCRYDEHQRQGRGAFVFRDRLVDASLYEQAKNLLRFSRAIGMRK